MSRSITTWNRLEPRSSHSGGPGPGLQARVYDPAWMLGRQWQLGELAGEDAGSPAIVRVHLATSRLTRYQPGSDPAGAVVDLHPDRLLEALVEAEAGEPTDWRSSAEAAAHLLALLSKARLGGIGKAFGEAYPFATGAPAPAGTTPDDARIMRLLARRSFDGAELRRAVRAAAAAEGAPVALPERPAIADEHAPRVLELLSLWLGWYPEPEAATAWRPERLEHAFTAAGPAPLREGEIVLEAAEYEGGRLDWPDFHVAEGHSLGAATDAEPDRVVHAAIPAPVSYPGMPASRWWEFEPGSVSFGAVETEAGDIPRMLLVEFATVYGNDWFVVPLEVEAGTLAGIEWLVVVDTFGQATLVMPTEVARPDAWTMFQMTGASPGLLFVPKVAGHALEGPVLEEVLLLRDETANMAWGVESTVTGTAGRQIDRAERWRARSDPTPPADAPPGALGYRVATDVPDHWIPLVPRSDGHRSIRLERGSIVRPDGREIEPLGRLLEPPAPERPLSIFEEELPRSGIMLTRRCHLARTPDGATLAWIGRQRRPGRGEGSSGLAFDQLHEPAPDDDAGSDG